MLTELEKINQDWRLLKVLNWVNSYNYSLNITYYLVDWSFLNYYWNWITDFKIFANNFRISLLETNLYMGDQMATRFVNRCNK